MLNLTFGVFLCFIFHNSFGAAVELSQLNDNDEQVYQVDLIHGQLNQSYSLQVDDGNHSAVSYLLSTKDINFSVI